MWWENKSGLAKHAVNRAVLYLWLSQYNLGYHNFCFTLLYFKHSAKCRLENWHYSWQHENTLFLDVFVICLCLHLALRCRDHQQWWYRFNSLTACMINLPNLLQNSSSICQELWGLSKNCVLWECFHVRRLVESALMFSGSIYSRW